MKATVNVLCGGDAASCIPIMIAMQDMGFERIRDTIYESPSHDITARRSFPDRDAAHRMARHIMDLPGGLVLGVQIIMGC